MGLYDRDYSRYDQERPFLASVTYPFIVGVTVLCVVFFIISLFQRSITGFVELSWMHLVQDNRFWTLLTHPFVHPTNSPFPIVFNLLVFYFFGKELEDRFGWQGMLAITLCAMVAGALGLLAGSAAGWLSRGDALLGMSGVANAVLVAGVLLDPRRSRLLFFVLPVPGWAIVAFSLLMDLMRVSSGDGGAGQAAADILGMAAGAGSFQVLSRGWYWPRRRVLSRQRAKPRLAVYRGEEDQPMVVPFRPRVVPAETSLPDNLNLELDRILEKISQQGIGKLSDSERQVLLKASESLKKRP